LSKPTLRVLGAGKLAHGESRTLEFELPSGQEAVAGFVLRHQDSLVAYVNRCPHWAVDLDMGDERFYAEDVDRIYCKNHGALFRVTDGVCDHGPCMGQALQAFGVTLEGDDAWLSWPEKP
jgi:nitrite reductase/ring-hydroxylating ferredoxin subunit